MCTHKHYNVSECLQTVQTSTKRRSASLHTDTFLLFTTNNLKYVYLLAKKRNRLTLHPTVSDRHTHRHTRGFTSLLVCMHTTLCITAKELVYTALFSHPEWTDGPPLWMALTESIFSAQPHRKADIRPGIRHCHPLPLLYCRDSFLPLKLKHILMSLVGQQRFQGNSEEVFTTELHCYSVSGVQHVFCTWKSSYGMKRSNLASVVIALLKFFHLFLMMRQFVFCWFYTFLTRRFHFKQCLTIFLQLVFIICHLLPTFSWN